MRIFGYRLCRNDDCMALNKKESVKLALDLDLPIPEQLKNKRYYKKIKKQWDKEAPERAERRANARKYITECRELYEKSNKTWEFREYDIETDWDDIKE